MSDVRVDPTGTPLGGAATGDPEATGPAAAGPAPTDATGAGEGAVGPGTADPASARGSAGGGPRPARPDRPGPRGRSGAARWALLWVVPYLLFGVSWVFSNPPGASPDESDHLTKAIAAARFDIGVPFTGSFGDAPVLVRNASIARTVAIPANLVPEGYQCFMFQPNQTAACLPQGAPASGDPMVERTTAVGAYPVFGYIPLGLATLAADSPTRAFHLARLASLVMSLALLFLAVWHLTRWLGRGAAVGLALGITPMAIFAASSVSTSGIEIFGAAAVAAVVVVACRAPATLADRWTLTVFTVGACALVLSRQLGVVTFGLLALIVLVRGGWRVVWGELRRGRPAMIVSIGLIALSGVAIVVWESLFDHPALIGPWLSADALDDFVVRSMQFVESGIGLFGWLDTPLPGPALALWVVLLVTLIGAALLLGRRADQLTLVAALLVLVGVAYVTYATVFFSVSATLQGRHLLALFVFVPTLAGVMVAEHVRTLGRPTAAARAGTAIPAPTGGPPARTLGPRLALAVGIGVPLVQLMSIYANARRYAVGLDAPFWFAGLSQWAPRGGWLPWFALAAVGAVGMSVMIIRGGREPVGLAAEGAPEGEMADVAR